MVENVTSENDEESQQAYTVFTISQRRYLTYLLGYLTLASSLTATIYFPLIRLLSVQYQVSIQAINSTITVYVIFQALSPAFFAPISDTLGRRPIFLITFAIYLAASIGLALNKSSYVALILLRALQSIGGSAVLSLAYAVVADISVHAERGKILGPLLASANLGPCIGPVIGGGVILASQDPQWCFWALTVFGASALMLIGWTLQETSRNVVGNGALHPHYFWRTWWNVISSFSFPWPCTRVSLSAEKRDGADELNDSPTVHGNSGEAARGKLSWPNPFASLRIIFFVDTFLILWTAASPYAVWYTIQTTIPLVYSQVYGYNDLIVGFCFLSGGLGVIFGGVVAGRLMDMNYKHVAKETGFSTDRVAGDDIRHFPIERARSRGSFIILPLSICALTGYGWAIEYGAHSSIPLILQFVIGARCTITLQVFSALLVDIFPERPGTAAASNNITRCALSAAAVAAIEPLVGALGRGWFFTSLALVDGLCGLAAVWALQRWGWHWRNKRVSD